MQTIIRSVQNSILKDYIQSYIFFNHDGNKPLQYTTFPNTNLCLALYKNNQISYFNHAPENRCILSAGKNTFSSRIFAFHQSPFQVTINAAVDQVCILFHPGALSAFTRESYFDLLYHEHPFECIFPASMGVLDHLFSEQNHARRVSVIEQFLVEYLIPSRMELKVNEILYYINSPSERELKVNDLAVKMNINTSTLYRMFFSCLGQNPKSFLQTVRFRKALNNLLSGKFPSLTSIAYSNHYYDQAHFIKDIKALSGETPRKLIDNVFLEQQQLAWICKHPI